MWVTQIAIFVYASVFTGEMLCPYMRRRDILRRTGAAVGAGLLAGCLDRAGNLPGGSAPDDGNESSGNPDNGSSDDGPDDGTTTERPSVSDRSIEVVDAGCGNEIDGTASVEFDRAGDAVVVTGTINGRNACEKPRLEAVDLAAESRELSVTVGTKKGDDAMGCAECITEIEYRATLSFDGSLPESVKVVHKSLGETTTVTTASRDGTTEGT